MNYETAWKVLKQTIQGLLMSYDAVFDQDDPDPKLVAAANYFQVMADLMETMEDIYQLEEKRITRWHGMNSNTK